MRQPLPLPDFLKDIPFEDLDWMTQLGQLGVETHLPELERYEFRCGPNDGQRGNVVAHWFEETGVTISRRGDLGPTTKSRREVVAWVLSLLPSEKV